ncbi:MAG: hypothetical protein HY459_02555 [Parcubacteria group bacterium]|nr:hypothetical protein [Parcubacteria group bacterium]
MAIRKIVHAKKSASENQRSVYTDEQMAGLARFFLDRVSNATKKTKTNLKFQAVLRIIDDYRRDVSKVIAGFHLN